MIRIHLSGFFSKWGFYDGDMDILDEYTWNKGISARKLFYLLVKYEILPKIKNKIVYEYINSCHNNHRISEIDGIKVDWYDTDKKYSISPEYVEIDDETINKYIQILLTDTDTDNKQERE